MSRLFIIQLWKVLFAPSSEQIRIPNQTNYKFIPWAFLVNLHTQCRAQAWCKFQPDLSSLSSFPKKSDGERVSQKDLNPFFPSIKLRKDKTKLVRSRLAQALLFHCR